VVTKERVLGWWGVKVGGHWKRKAWYRPENQVHMKEAKTVLWQRKDELVREVRGTKYGGKGKSFKENQKSIVRGTIERIKAGPTQEAKLRCPTSPTRAPWKGKVSTDPKQKKNNDQ